MGLEEKRKIKEYTDKTIPERTQELAEICGCPIPYEIAWETFSDDAEALRFLDNASFHRTNMAFRVICADTLGKEAVKEGLTLIKLRNVKNREEMKISFENKVLEMHCAYAIGAQGMWSDNEIREAVLKKL
ncbi:hypothetical protein WDW37_12840 [Bdellovibrionota bacterium FG-1]